jgi:hypothetical protein
VLIFFFFFGLKGKVVWPIGIYDRKSCFTMSIKIVDITLDRDACILEVAVGYNGPCGGDCGGCGGRGRAIVRIRSPGNSCYIEAVEVKDGNEKITRVAGATEVTITTCGDAEARQLAKALRTAANILERMIKGENADELAVALGGKVEEL